MEIFPRKLYVFKIVVLFFAAVLVSSHPFHDLLENNVLSPCLAKQVEKFNRGFCSFNQVTESLISFMDSVICNTFINVFNLFTVELIMETFKGIPEGYFFRCLIFRLISCNHCPLLLIRLLLRLFVVLVTVRILLRGSPRFLNASTTLSFGLVLIV